MHPSGRLFSLSRPETEAMEKYLSEALAAGLIRPSLSAAGAGFFFVGKKDWSLCPCVPECAGPGRAAVSGIREPRLPASERYDRSPGGCRSFLTQCQLIFDLQPQTFPTNAARVAYIVTQLTGRARS